MLKLIIKLASLILICSVSLLSYANDENKYIPPDDLQLVEKQIYNSLEKNGLPKSSISINWSISVSGDYIATIKCKSPEKCGEKEVSIPFTNKNLINNEASSFLKENQAKQLRPLLKNTGNEGPQNKPLINGELENYE
ncbi:hypothetical protein [Legionella impletisoli]|uniref:Uncharacterized protein n=1 Tax=Legionella impletisoli TaxID=343510 RepID=A0A917K0B0_9GAMM|nr:hypothetical protein [Legionella impletisoli]GGI92296.1 hypothetical protein GCM10007966_21160 [Legionella impletisoli]